MCNSEIQPYLRIRDVDLNARSSHKIHKDRIPNRENIRLKAGMKSDKLYMGIVFFQLQFCVKK